ncbi:MAG: hypothetical protein R3Y11_02340 [Pseudomonadota bacterium]
MQNNIRLRSYNPDITEINGDLSPNTTTFGKGYLAHIWQCMESEGLHRAVFYDGAVRCAEDLANLLAPGRAWAYCFEVHGQVLALWWCNGHAGHMAQIHFCIFEAGRPHGHYMGMTAVRFIMKVGKCDVHGVPLSNDSAPVSVLCGVTPAPYRHAIGYATKLGFQITAALPRSCYLSPNALGGRKHGRYVDGVLTILKREDCV